MHVLACPAKKELMSDQPHDAEKSLQLSDRDAQQNGLAHVPERRTHPRRRIASLEYVDLGGGNGGIIINLSEDGMYVQAVGGLIDADLPLITFRVPQSRHRVETSGRIVWAGQSKKDAGIQFVNLPDEARAKIREWISSENAAVEPAGELEPMPGTARTNREPSVESPRSHMALKIPAGPLVSHPSIASGTGLPDPPANSAHAIFDSTTVPEPSSLNDFELVSANEAPPPARRAKAYVLSESRSGLAVIVAFVAAISLLAGWVASRSGSVKQAVALNPNLTAGQPAPADTAPAVATVTPATAKASSTATPLPPTRGLPASSQGTNAAAAAFTNPTAAPHPTDPQHPSAAPVLAEKLPTPAPSTEPAPHNAAEPAAGTVKGVVSVNASPYPSPLVPPGFKPKVAGQNRTAQIGQLLSRVEPIYPESAERDRVEGVVKLHAIIDIGGNVRVDQSAGPPPLVDAAAAAVQQWRYTPTTLGGQPIGAELSVTITFRLQVLPTSAN